MKLDTYKVVFATGSPGVYAISLVKDPAIGSTFIALSSADNVIKLKAVEEAKHLLLGAVLIPDKPIFRKDGDEKFNIVFDAETIRLASQHFMKNGHQNNSSLEHDQKVKLSGVSFVESWIKEDDVNDKSVKYGIDVPVGSWLAVMKVDNPELWDEFVSTGEVAGFSIEGLFDLEEIKLSTNKDEKMKNEIIDGVVEKLKSMLPAFIKLGKASTTDNEVTFNFEGDTLEAGTTQLTMTGPDGELPVPDGTYEVTIDEKKVSLEVKDSVVQTITDVTEEEDDDDKKPPVETQLSDEQKAAAATVKSTKETKETIFALANVVGKAVSDGVAKVREEFQAELAKKDEQIIALTKAKGEAGKKWEDMTPLERHRAAKKA